MRVLAVLAAIGRSILLLPVGLNAWGDLAEARSTEARAEAYAAEGRAALEAGDIQRAVVALQRARDAAADDATRIALLGAQAQLVATDPQALTGPTALALEVALRVTPEAGDPTVRALALGEIALARGRLDEAKRWFADAVERDAKRASAHFGLGKVAAVRNETEAAERHLAAAAKAAPQDWRMRRAYAVALGKLEKWTLAEGELTAATELNDDPTLHLKLGEARVKLKNFEGAVKPLEVAVSKLTDGGARAEARSKLGFCYFQAGRHAEAIDQLQRSARERPDPMTVFNLGVAYETTGDRARAADLYQRALLDAPSNVEANVRLVQALAGLGRVPAARSALVRLQRLAKGRPALDKQVERAATAVAAAGPRPE